MTCGLMDDDGDDGDDEEEVVDALRMGRFGVGYL